MLAVNLYNMRGFAMLWSQTGVELFAVVAVFSGNLMNHGQTFPAQMCGIIMADLKQLTMR